MTISKRKLVWLLAVFLCLALAICAVLIVLHVRERQRASFVDMDIVQIQWYNGPSVNEVLTGEEAEEVELLLRDLLLAGRRGILMT